MTGGQRPEVGTVLLDGLIEGPVPPYPDGHDRLEQWLAFAKSNGIPFQLTIDGPGFSLLVGNEQLRLDAHDDLQDRLKQAIEQLLSLFPEDLRGRLFSTVRSVEYREGQSIQSVYAVTSKGVNVHERRMPWRETKVAEGGGRKIPASHVIFVGTIAIVGLIASTFFIDYKAHISRLGDSYFPLDVEKIEVDGAAISKYVSSKKLDASGKHLELELRRTPEFPTEMAAYNKAMEALKEKGQLRDLISLSRLILDGEVRIEYLDREGKVLASGNRSIRDLLDKEAIVIQLPVREHTGTVKVRLTD